MEQWLLPAAIVLVKVLIKLLIDHRVDLPETIEAVLAVPFDIAFVAASLLSSLVILDVNEVRVGLGLFTMSIVVGLVAAFLWRRSTDFFDREAYAGTIGLFLLNLVITLGTAAYVVDLLRQGSLR